MIFIEETKNSAKWVDENYSKLPPKIKSVIKDTIREYYKKYKDAEYFYSREDYDSMMHWVALADCDDEMEEELL